MTTSHPDTSPRATASALPAQIVDASAVALSHAIRQRALSCRELMSACLARIDAVNPAHNAIVERVPQDLLLARADERDKDLANGRYYGPLHGFPLAPKDLLAVASMPTSMGSRLFAGKPAAADSVTAERLAAAGTVFVGRTNVPEFGLGGHTYNAVFGTTGNAWNPSRSAGGSSGGAAVALATRMLPVADGSDMMGSLRTPAAFNNVFGFRPTAGLIPAGPTPELFLNPFSTEGPMARTVPDLLLLLEAMAGRDARVPASIETPAGLTGAQLARDFKGTRIGWLADLGGAWQVEPDVLNVCERALPAFAQIGCSVERLEASDFGFPLPTLWHSWRTLRSFLLAGRLGPQYQDPAKRALMKAELVWEIEQGLAISAMDMYAASEARSRWYQHLRGLFDTYDYLVLPAAQVMPFDATWEWPSSINGVTMDTYHRWMEIVIPATMAGVPVVSAPAGFNAAGLPMGLQIMGRSRDDFGVLQLADAFDQARGGADVSRPRSAN